MTRIGDEALDLVREQGFVVIEGFLDADTLAAAQAGFHEDFPTRDEFDADPQTHGWLREHPRFGLRKGPFRSLDVNRLGHHPDLLDAAERFCGTTDVELYKTELWAKYGGGVDYTQELHRDFGNHTLVVPRADGRWVQMTTFVFLSDITEDDGPTVVVPRQFSDHVALSIRENPGDVHDLARHEVPAIGPAGSLLIYTTDVFHRGSAIKGDHRYRCSMLLDYMERGPQWQGRMRWADTATRQEEWDAILGDATPKQREIYGFPPVGHEYWNAQTIADVGTRWPTIDMSVYRQHADFL